jgi:hypothetical protein
MTAQSIVDALLESPEIKTMKKHRRTLTPEEKAAFDGAGNDRSATAMKAVINGKTWYGVWTHRCGKVFPTLKAAVSAYPGIASTG